MAKISLYLLHRTMNGRCVGMLKLHQCDHNLTLDGLLELNTKQTYWRPAREIKQAHKVHDSFGRSQRTHTAAKRRQEPPSSFHATRSEIGSAQLFAW